MLLKKHVLLLSVLKKTCFYLLIVCCCVVTPPSVLRYIAFDFHKECSKMRWHRLQILVDAVSDMQDAFGFVFISVPFRRKDCGL